MCWWGEALALGPTVNYEISESARQRASAAIEKAAALGANESARNRALIAALRLRYDFVDDDRGRAYRAYADAMTSLARDFPSDDELAALAADAWMMTDRAWWEADRATLRPGAAQAAHLLETLLRRNPRHIFAIHLYIHLVENSRHLERAIPYLAHLTELAPDSSHMIHMASHVHFRLGRYSEAMATNLKAIRADERFARLSGAEGGVAALPTYPHNAYFGISSALLAGEVRAATELAQSFLAKAPLSEAIPVWMHPIYALASMTVEANRDPELTLGQERPTVEAPLIQAIWHYNRAGARLRTNAVEAANEELRKISTLARAEDPMPRTHRLTIDLARLELAARIALARNDLEEATALYSEAADLQDAGPVLDPPLWWFPLRRELAAALLRAGKIDRAAVEIDKVLSRWPNEPKAMALRAEIRREGSAPATDRIRPT